MHTLATSVWETVPCGGVVGVALSIVYDFARAERVSR